MLRVLVAGLLFTGLTAMGGVVIGASVTKAQQQEQSQPPSPDSPPPHRCHRPPPVTS